MPGRESSVSALITCEHATGIVPARWRQLFERDPDVLDSHRGWDRGALNLARHLALRLDARLLAGRITRLLIDLNRSAGHPARYSEFSRSLPMDEQRRLESEYWLPHWQAYREYLESLPGQIIHIACHSFVPELNGHVRKADIGLLYDPARSRERDWCRNLAKCIRAHLPGLKLRMNYPYRGTSNGMGQQHRVLFDDRRLITMELEVNQRLVEADDWPGTIYKLGDAVATAIKSWTPDSPINPATA